MRYGRFLPEGGTLGFVAPSFGCNEDPYYSCFIHAREIWEKKGFQINEGPNVYAGCGIGISNTPQKCAQEFMDLYRSEDTDVLISCGGGELMCEILEYIDFKALRAAPPKWFMGYSDNTNLTFLLTTLCDTASIYGPCAAAFGMEPWHESLSDALAVLQGKKQVLRGYDLWEKESLKSAEHPLCPYQVTEPRILHTVPEGPIRMEGRLLGGCLDCLATLCGTRYDRVKEFVSRYQEDGILWFLEACDLNVMGIRRALWQLYSAGWFSGAKGFLIGRPVCWGQELMGLDQYQAVTDVLGRCGVPIIMDADLGHLPPMMPLICGAKADISVQGNDLTVAMSAR